MKLYIVSEERLENIKNCSRPLENYGDDLEEYDSAFEECRKHEINEFATHTCYQSAGKHWIMQEIPK